MLLEYASCGVIIGISDVDNHLVVAYRGTMNSEQLVEQLLTAFAGMTKKETLHIMRGLEYYLKAKRSNVFYLIS